MDELEFDLPSRDYVSPGFSRITLDPHFPNMIKVMDKKALSRMADLLKWRKPYHYHYVDRRAPNCGFVNRDEAHILYNTALRYSDKQALEIGCWLGWSACHLLAGGITLDVVDPVLTQKAMSDSVWASINSANLGANVKLVSDSSPDAVAKIGEKDKKKWSLFFIDGNHAVPGPLVDAFICTRYAEPNSLVLFHDLWSSAVAEALDYLKSEGWNTIIYNTFAIMAAAWRGDMEPVTHIPDPETDWIIPDNLKHHPVSGM